jgi:hypothetical protein
MKLGLDFGNVIKFSGGEMMYAFHDALPKLVERFGREIYVISRVDNAFGAGRALQYLEDYRLLESIPFSHIHFCLLRNEKGPIAQRLGLTHFVDDRLECLHYMNSVQFRYALNPTLSQMTKFPLSDKGVKMLTDWNSLLPEILKDSQ